MNTFARATLDGADAQPAPALPRSHAYHALEPSPGSG